MASNVVDVKQIDVKSGLLSLSPEVFSLLESQETQVCEGIKTLIQENLSSTKEAWLVHSLVDYYYLTQSYSVVGILCLVQEPQDKNLLEKLHDGIKSQEHQLDALQLLLHIVCKQPSWINKIVGQSVLKVIIKCLKAETSIPVLMTAVTIVTVLLPSIPTSVGPYLPDIFEIFNKLASYTVKKPPGNTPDIFYLHLQIAVYALFHRLYGMFPYTFLAYLRQYYTKKENIAVFDEVIKCMLERVRLHPLLITGSRDQETSTQRWRHMETHDVVVECNKMSLDPVEGTWEELHCPIVASRYLSDRPATNQERQRHTVPPLTLPSVSVATLAHHETSQGIQAQDTFWSPSEVIGLSTPPATPAVSSLETSTGSVTTQYVSPAVILNAGTPMNTPRETPPISEEHDRHVGRTSSRGTAPLKPVDPKRLSSEFPLSQTVPLLTPSSHASSVPPSPLKAEFTNTPPLGVKTLPVINAARELQFDHDHLEDKSVGHMTKINQSQVEFSKHVVKPEPFEIRPPRKISEGQMSTDRQNTPNRSGSATMFEDSLKESSQEAGESTEKVRTRSDRSAAVKTDTVSVDTISQVIEELESQPSHDEDSDDEVSELTSSSRSHGGHSAMLTSESVKKFMKNVNRIRFNSLTATNSIEPEQSKGFSSKRSRSCPQFPKIEATMEEDEELISRSASVTCQDMAMEDVQFNTNVGESHSEDKKEPTPVSAPQPSDNMCDISISSTGSTVTVNKKHEPVTMPTTQPCDETVSKCPVYSGKPSSSESKGEVDDLMHILKQVLNMPSATNCAKCQGQIDGSQTGPTKPFFSTFSPPELLDRHIRLGKDIHAKELSKLPIPSTQEVNWTHFGGMPPADEVSILRGQLMLLHNQLMYERHKRDQHAKRNRRLLRKIAHTKTLEEQNNSMGEQLKQNEMMIRDLQVSLKLLQEENRKLKSSKDSEEYEKLVQLRSCLQENEDLKNVKKEFNMLLVRQREEQDNLNKRLMATEAKLFNTEKELEKMRDVASLNTKLKDQVLQFQKEVLLMGELQQKCNDKLLANKASRATRLEHEHAKAVLHKQLEEKTRELADKTLLLEGCQHQLKEQHDLLSNRETALSELKLTVEKIKTSHEDELKCVQDKHLAATHVNQALESHILQLYMEIEEVKAKLKGGVRTSVAMDAATSQDDKGGDSVQEFRERTSSDPLQQSPTLKKKTLTRMTSLPVGGGLGLGLSSASDLHTQRSPNINQGSQAPKQTVVVEEEDYELIDPRGNVDDFDERHTGSETTSVSSRDSNLFPGQRNLLFTDSEDNRSASNRSSNMGDSGVC
ncbi:hamartin-like isoform X2 [Mercenaria mercenaria]|nr:hamartin-like isoform X2 [Mercenaria mercenaria]XP_053380722.1 hamartin-like isoform X2 [Mercenaria mercenaria]